MDNLCDTTKEYKNGFIKMSSRIILSESKVNTSALVEKKSALDSLSTMVLILDSNS